MQHESYPTLIWCDVRGCPNLARHVVFSEKTGTQQLCQKHTDQFEDDAFVEGIEYLSHPAENTCFVKEI